MHRGAHMYLGRRGVCQGWTYVHERGAAIQFYDFNGHGAYLVKRFFDQKLI
jgi:hypothetical protein